MSEGGVARTTALEAIRRGYSKEEIRFIYRQIRGALINGEIRWARSVSEGLTEIAPDFLLGWLALCYTLLFDREFEKALQAARQALRIDPSSLEALLFISSASMSLGDFQSAGTYLGEATELLEVRAGTSESLRRLTSLLLDRYNQK